MNHFILDYDIDKSVQYHCNQHVVKIILEMCQVASTNMHVIGFSNLAPYKPTHANHPITKWGRENLANFRWICEYGIALCREYTFRYRKIHKCFQYLLDMNCLPVPLSHGDRTPFCQCMPEQYKCKNVVQAYRNYYIGEKMYFAKWTKRKVPEWINYKLIHN